jgi:hypothetical protein
MSLTAEPEILGWLAPVSLDELMALADLQTRRDRKYLVPRPLIDRLIDEVGAGGRVLTIDGIRSFRYESVYFDTADLVSYLGAARRRPHRFKVRTRTYLDTGGCMLEVKTRDARRRTVKHRHPYDIEHRAELTDTGRRFTASIDHTAPAVDQLRPVLTTLYRRTTLVLADVHAQARVTIDLDVTWEALRPVRRNGPGRPDGHRARLSHLALVETKTLGPPCAADRALWRQGHRPVTISKYCTGLAALRPYLPANKWNRVLRHHCDWFPAQHVRPFADRA